MRIDPGRAALGLAALLALTLAWCGLRSSGGLRQPAYTEDAMPPIEPHLARADELSFATYLQHRYPVSVGGEISTVIHRGWAGIRIDETDPLSSWMMAPPGEQGVLG